ncbi:MAG: glycosyl hydrolase family 65 protein [Thermoguttaceae bacterium]
MFRAALCQICCLVLFQSAPPVRAEVAAGPAVLKPEAFRHYVDEFNGGDRELYAQEFPNAAAWEFLRKNVPLLDCPDKQIEEIYYFRWWTYRKHIKRTPDGWIITEFLPNVGWAGKHNSINCAAGHHLREGRWLADPKFLDDYCLFWFRKGGAVRSYSFWAADSIWSRFLVSGDDRLIRDLLPDLIANYEAWEKEHRDANGLFWQSDDRDGMEVSIGGSGYRATINSYMYGDAVAIAEMAARLGQPAVARRFRSKAAEIRRRTQEMLWDPQAQFFKVLPRRPGALLCDARELHGYTPWYFNLPEGDQAPAWKQLLDPQGFWAPFGPTTAEQRHAKFALSYAGHECQWNGPSWPYATAVTLTAMANLLNNYRQDVVGRNDYLELLKIYAKSQHRKLADGRSAPWIDENLNPRSGDWISRSLLLERRQTPLERGKDYNHSTYCDLVINGLVGLRPQADESVEVNPLVPAGTWDYFCLDQVRYHGRWLTIVWDRTGERYGRGKGLQVLADGHPIAASDQLTRLCAPLPHPADADAGASGGWRKYQNNPVMGGKYGTCFDVSVLKEGDLYRMWLSWRPRKSIALVQSKDGIHWSEPPQIVLEPRTGKASGTQQIVLEPRTGEASGTQQIVLEPGTGKASGTQGTGKASGTHGPGGGWQDEVNRPCVLRRGDGYHMWYTGQARGHSWIGYAISPDGVRWQRQSASPVLSPEKPWEREAVMCPHVMWDDAAKMFRMWYSAGQQYEPDAVGYATSSDGLKWTKHASNPIFRPDPRSPWEQHKVTAVQVLRQGEWYVMFYIGFRDVDHAQIGLARSRDGINSWQRHAANPIVRPGRGEWDHDACYKPYAIFDGRQWLLWYNGRHGSLEQIGVALHEGEDLGF